MPPRKIRSCPSGRTTIERTRSLFGPGGRHYDSAPMTSTGSPIPAPTAGVLDAVAAEHPYPLLFATISGAHLYGFPSPDSDFDLRGVHLLPVREVVGLKPLRETIEMTGDREGLEIDLVT